MEWLWHWDSRLVTYYSSHQAPPALLTGSISLTFFPHPELLSCGCAHFGSLDNWRSSFWFLTHSFTFKHFQVTRGQVTWKHNPHLKGTQNSRQLISHLLPLGMNFLMFLMVWVMHLLSVILSTAHRFFLLFLLTDVLDGKMEWLCFGIWTFDFENIHFFVENVLIQNGGYILCIVSVLDQYICFHMY